MTHLPSADRISPVRPAWPTNVALYLLAGLLCAGHAFADAEAETSSQTAEAQSEVSAAGSKSADGEDASAETEGNTDEGDEQWVVDEETGAEYFIAEIPKVEGTYRRVGESMVRFPGGATMLLVDETDDSFFVRSYRPQASAYEGIDKKAPEVPEAPPEVMPETVDRLVLEPFDEGLPRGGQWRNGFDLADMNGDGHLDIVFGPARKSRPVPYVFLGDSEGHWRVWNTTFPSWPYDYGDVTAADWNGDGHMDLGLAAHLRGLVALVGDGEGKFELWSDGLGFTTPGQGGSSTSAFTSRAIDHVDWNGDGRLDLVGLGEGPKPGRFGPDMTGRKMESSRGIRVYLNQGDGSWDTVSQKLVSSTIFGDDLEIVDLDGDGRLDIVGSSAIVGNRNVLISENEEKILDAQKLSSLRPKSLIDGVETADFDEDGKLDIAITFRSNETRRWRNGVDIFFAREDGWKRSEVLVFARRESMRALAAGDLDQDGHVDLAMVDDNGVLRILLGRGDGTFLLEDTPEGPEAIPGCQGYDIEIVDLNGDGFGEIVAAYAGEPQGQPALGVGVPGCPNGGSLKAWSARPKPPEAQADAG